MKKCLIIALAAASLISGACSRDGAAGSRPTLCVSIEPQRKMLEEIAGDDYTVVTMLKAGADPETFEPSVAQRMALSDADAYFTVGTLPFERKLAVSETDVYICRTSLGISTLDDSHHGGADPHIWTSLRNGRRMAANMLDVLTKLNPPHAELYRRRYEKMAARLDSLDDAISRNLERAHVKAFAIWHPSLSYYASDYGLTQIAAHASGKEMSPGELAEMIGAARADSVTVFFSEKDLGSRQASTVNAEIGSRMVDINTLSYDWEKQISLISDALSQR